MDELDRCRPPFALDIVERIKHLFSVPGVCFVLVTHLPQLETSVQGAYGATFDAYTYLEKFYQLRVVLPQSKRRGPYQNDAYIDHLWRRLNITFADPAQAQVVRKQLKLLLDAYDLSLRRLERVMTHISLVEAATRSRRLFIPQVVTDLCVMRHTAPDLYDKARKRSLTWDAVQKFFQPSEGRGMQSNWISDWWKFATYGMSQDELKAHARELDIFNLGDPADLIPIMAGYIDELAQQPPGEG